MKQVSCTSQQPQMRNLPQREKERERVRKVRKQADKSLESSSAKAVWQRNLHEEKCLFSKGSSSNANTPDPRSAEENKRILLGKALGSVCNLGEACILCRHWLQSLRPPAPHWPGCCDAMECARAFCLLRIFSQRI